MVYYSSLSSVLYAGKISKPLIRKVSASNYEQLPADEHMHAVKISATLPISSYVHEVLLIA
jgi:hypothetical protein